MQPEAIPSFQQVLAVLLVFALLAGLLFLLRRKGLVHFATTSRNGGRRRQMESVERLALTPHHSLHLVRVADRVILLSLSPAGCQVIESQVKAAVNS